MTIGPPSSAANAFELEFGVTGSGWKDLAGWEHSWDAADPGVAIYYDYGTAYNIPATYRVASIPDGSGNLPLHKDEGPYMGSFSLPPAPGPLWLINAPAFNGRQAFQTDVIELIQGFFTNYHSLLSPFHDAADSSKWLGWAQPWWGAMLCTLAPGLPTGACDGDPGAATISLLDTVSIATWNTLINHGATINSGFTPRMGQSVLIMWYDNGASSWLEVNYLSAGTLTTHRVAGSQGTATFQNCFYGWAHDSAISTIGLTRGTPATVNTDAIRAWATPYLS